MKAVAVDLTPLLPGGDNGGAKLFALEIVRALARLAPNTRFLLLTQAASHDELVALERDNVQRRLAVPAAAAGRTSRLLGTTTRMLSPLPPALKRRAARAGYAWHQRGKRRMGQSALANEHIDLLFCPFTAPTYRRAGLPTVCTLYDLQFDDYPQFFTPLEAGLRRAAFLDACENATLLAAISSFTRERAIEFAGLDPRRIEAIPLRLARRGSADPEVTARFGLQAGRFLLYPANFWKHKNHEMLLEAFANARRNGLPADIPLVCTGAVAAGLPAIERAASSLDLGSSVRFPGYVDDGTIGSLMAQCTALVFPSLYEGFGLPVADAMANAVPVACSDIPALREVAGDAARYFDPRVPAQLSEALVAIAQDAGLRARLVAAGRARAAEFTDVDRTARDYWQLFERARAQVT